MPAHTKQAWPQFLIFVLLCLLMLGLVPAGQIVLKMPSLDFAAMAERASAETGVRWTSNLINLVRLAMAEPGLWLLIIGSAAPTLAALLFLAIRRDGRGAAQWNQRFDLIRLVRALNARSAMAMVLVCGAILACLWITGSARQLISADLYRVAPSLAALIPALLVAAFLDQGALLEEGGWRGLGTPLLQDSGVAPLVVALAVGVAWGLWHLPRDIISGLPQSLGMATYVTLYLPAFLTGTVATSILAAFAMNRLGGSIWPAVIIHGLTNDSAGLSGLADIEQALTPLHQITKALPLALLALTTVAIVGPRLGYLSAGSPKSPDGAILQTRPGGGD